MHAWKDEDEGEIEVPTLQYAGAADIWCSTVGCGDRAFLRESCLWNNNAIFRPTREGLNLSIYVTESRGSTTFPFNFSPPLPPACNLGEIAEIAEMILGGE